MEDVDSTPPTSTDYSYPDREPPNMWTSRRRFPYADSNRSFHLERFPIASVHSSGRTFSQWPGHHPPRTSTAPQSATTRSIIRATVPDHSSVPITPTEPPLVPILRVGRAGTIRSDTPDQPSISTVHRPNRSPIRLTTFEQPVTRTYSVHFEKPISRTATSFDNASSEGFDQSNARIGTERPSTVFGNRVRFEIRPIRPVRSSSPDSGQVLSEGPAERGSEESVERVNIHQHIKQCSCTCNHMGYGNYMDFQEAKHEGTPPEESSRQSQREPAEDEETHQETIPKDGDEGGGRVGTKEPRTKAVCPLRVHRKWLALVTILSTIMFFCGISFFFYVKAFAAPESRQQLIARTLEEVPLIDGHNDLPWNIHKFVFNRLASFNLSADLRNKYPWNDSFSQTDLPRLRAGKVGAQFWSAYVPCTAQSLDALTLTMGQIDVIKRFTELYSKDFMLAKTSDDIIEAHRMGKIASLIGLEGGHSMDNSLGVLRMQYEVGARYLTLTHQCDTAWAECCLESLPEYTLGPEFSYPRGKGLTEFGRLVIREMNRLGMIIDLSHSSAKTMSDALDASKAPVIFSHSCAQALCNSSGNVPDHILRRLAKNGGIIMVSFYSKFLTCSHDSTFRDVIRHINHIRKVAGIDHVGIGAGFDGVDRLPKGLEDSSKYPALLVALLEDPTWSAEHIKKLIGLNFLRVFKEVETVRDKWKRAGVRPVEERIPHEDLRGLTRCIYRDV